MLTPPGSLSSGASPLGKGTTPLPGWGPWAGGPAGGGGSHTENSGSVHVHCPELEPGAPAG